MARPPAKAVWAICPCLPYRPLQNLLHCYRICDYSYSWKPPRGCDLGHLVRASKLSGAGAFSGGEDHECERVPRIGEATDSAGGSDGAAGRAVVGCERRLDAGARRWWTSWKRRMGWRFTLICIARRVRSRMRIIGMSERGGSFIAHRWRMSGRRWWRDCWEASGADPSFAAREAAG